MGLGKGRALPRSQNGRRAPMTIDALVLYTCFHYVYRSSIDLRASTSSSASFRVEECPLVFAAQIAYLIKSLGTSMRSPRRSR